MVYTFAPMEGITGYRFRNAHRALFPEADRYYTPFVSANHTLTFQNKELADIDPRNNEGVPLIPQVLAGKADEFLWAACELADRGYEEINLNLGCPSSTVMSRKKGSGFLGIPEELDSFFETFFEAREHSETLRNVRISVKTRMGVRDVDEHVRLMEIYNAYPIEELIIHARLAKDMYRGVPDLETFADMLAVSRHPVCYNGDVRTSCDAERIEQLFAASGKLTGIMIGRGAVRNPALFREIKCGEAGKLTKAEFRAYQDRLIKTYTEGLSGEQNVLHKIKEFWAYWGDLFVDSDVLVKSLFRTKDVANCRIIAEKILRECELK